MEAIADNVYIEDKYVGVTLGVITQPRGLIQIDAPPSPEDGRTWRASLRSVMSRKIHWIASFSSNSTRRA